MHLDVTRMHKTLFAIQSFLGDYTHIMYTRSHVTCTCVSRAQVSYQLEAPSPTGKSWIRPGIKLVKCSGDKIMSVKLLTNPCDPPGILLKPNDIATYTFPSNCCQNEQINALISVFCRL